ncbi:hypothetical protein HK101_010647 [Irineochytrium annulatum]|nr:hypothetical protein HK101_010647 [Irineochytrium annulatum]
MIGQYKLISTSTLQRLLDGGSLVRADLLGKRTLADIDIFWVAADYPPAADGGAGGPELEPIDDPDAAPDDSINVHQKDDQKAAAVVTEQHIPPAITSTPAPARTAARKLRTAFKSPMTPASSTSSPAAGLAATPIKKSELSRTRRTSSAFKSPMVSNAPNGGSLVKPFRSPAISKPGLTPLATPRPVNARATAAVAPASPSAEPDFTLFAPPSTSSSSAAHQQAWNACVLPLILEKQRIDKRRAELEATLKRRTLVAAYGENDEAAKVDALIEKWDRIARRALEDLRDLIGEVQVPPEVVAKAKGRKAEEEKQMMGNKEVVTGDRKSATYASWCAAAVAMKSGGGGILKEGAVGRKGLGSGRRSVGVGGRLGKENGGADFGGGGGGNMWCLGGGGSGGYDASPRLFTLRELAISFSIDPELLKLEDDA